jgi:uncharacterized protein (TIGR03083 family)
LSELRPVSATELFPELHAHLLELLKSLQPAEWELATAARLWNVKDIALHLLAGDIGILSRKRDGFTPGGVSIRGLHELVTFINQLNQTWLAATRRLSTRVLCDLLEFTGPQVEAYFSSLDPFATGEPVDWAGPERAPVWLDIGREYTERWHHQQQIRDATGKPGLYEPRVFAPVIETFVRALPQTFRHVAAPEGTTVALRVTGPAGSTWSVRRGATSWELHAGAADSPAAEVSVAAEDAWKIFTRGLPEQEAMKRASISGDQKLGAKVLQTVSVLA